MCIYCQILKRNTFVRNRFQDIILYLIFLLKDEQGAINAYANEALVDQNVKTQVKVWFFVLYICQAEMIFNIIIIMLFIFFPNISDLDKAPPSDSLTVIINNIEQQQPLIKIVQVNHVTTN